MSSTAKERASRHADRGWTCPCGKTVHGNGGKSGHQRACRTWKEHRLTAFEKVLTEIDAGTWGKGLRPSLVEKYRQDYAGRVDRLRKDLSR